MTTNLSGNMGGVLVGSPARAGFCCVAGCTGVAQVEDRSGDYCARCWEELDALRRMDEQRRRRIVARGERVHRIEVAAVRAVRWVWNWRWVPELVFVAGVIVYMSLEIGLAFRQWLEVR